jgi:hypothetical protein
MRPSPDAAVAITRRQFLACCSALAGAAAGCAAVTRDTRSAYALLTDPALADYEQVLGGLIRAVLPLELPAFPVTAAQVQARLLSLFRLERDPRFLLLQRSFMLFDQTDLFPQFARLAAEHERLEGRATKDHWPQSEDDGHDGELYARFERGGMPSRFTTLPVNRQREYFELWRQSRLLLRREFHATARSLVMITAYSMPQMWAVIGYEGPVRDHPPGRS